MPTRCPWGRQSRIPCVPRTVETGHPFGDDLHVQGRAPAAPAPAPRGVSASEAHHWQRQPAVELEHIGTDVGQQRAHRTGPEVVERDPDADASQRPHRTHDLCASASNVALCAFFEHDLALRTGSCVQVDDAVDERRVEKPQRRDVDADRGSVAPPPLSLIHLRVAAHACCSTQSPIGTITPVSSATGMNSPASTPSRRWSPLHQRFRRLRPLGHRREDRLVLHGLSSPRAFDSAAASSVRTWALERSWLVVHCRGAAQRPWRRGRRCRRTRSSASCRTTARSR